MDNKNSKEQTNIIVMQGNEENKGPRLTFGEYIHQVNAFKWWIIAVTLLGGIGGFVGTKYILNPKRELVTSTLSFNLPLNEDQNQFVDGSSFNGRDLVSKENIKAVIEANEEFKGLDAQSVYDAFSRTAVNGEDSIASKTDFVLTTNVEPFKNSTVAKSFIGALIDYEVNEISAPKIQKRTLATPFTGDEAKDRENRKNSSYETGLSLLSTLDKVLSQTYSERIGKFTSSAIGYNGQTLLSLKQSYLSVANSLEVLSGKEKRNFYVNFQDGKEQEKRDEYRQLGSTYKSTLRQVEEELLSKKETLGRLSSINVPDANVSLNIAALTKEISQLTKEKSSLVTSLKDIGYTISDTSADYLSVSNLPDSGKGFYSALEFYKENKNGSDEAKKEEALSWKEGSDAFLLSLNTRYLKYQNEYSSLNETCRILYQSGANSIYIQEAGNGLLSKHISPYLVAIVFLLVAFALSSLVLSLIGRNIDYKKGLKKEIPDEKTPEEKKAEDHTNLDCDRYTKDR